MLQGQEESIPICQVVISVRFYRIRTSVMKDKDTADAKNIIGHILKGLQQAADSVAPFPEIAVEIDEAPTTLINRVVRGVVAPMIGMNYAVSAKPCCHSDGRTSWNITVTAKDWTPLRNAKFRRKGR